MKEKKRIKTKIRVGYIVKANVLEIYENTREGRIRRIIKEMFGCVQTVAGKKRFLVKFLDGQKKYMSSSFLVF